MGNNNNKTKRNIDVVFCIDGTGSMTPCIEDVKSNARRFYSEFSNALIKENSEITMLRVKVIIFRDYKSDGQDSMIISPFFELPSDQEEFSSYLSDIEADGGCGEDANGLEALYFAMKSDFTTGLKDRQVIVLFADTDAIEIRKRERYSNYPKDMVKNKSELINIWACPDQYKGFKLRDHNKRLVMFAPKNTVYQEFAKKLDRSVFTPVNMSGGLGDIAFDSIIKIIAASAGNKGQ